MAFTYTLRDRISFGNLKMRSYDITNVSTGGSIIEVGMNCVQVKALNNTDSADTFVEVISTAAGAKSRGNRNVFLTAGTADDDGHFIVWGR